MDVRQKLEKIKYRIRRRIPDNAKYYTQTSVGLILILSSLGTTLVPPRSILIGLIHLVAGLYVIPDIRYRVLYKLKIKEPKYSVVAIVFISILVTGGIVNSDLGPSKEFYEEKEDSYYQVISSSIEVDQREKSKQVHAEAKVRNRGVKSGNYTVVISRNEEEVTSMTKRISEGKTATFSYNMTLGEYGEYNIDFYSDLNGNPSQEEQFAVQEAVEIPYYLSRENIRNAAQSYSQIPHKDMDNILSVEITNAGKAVKIVNKVSNPYSISDLIKTATVNSFHSTKEVSERFEGVEDVIVQTVADHRYNNGTIKERMVLITNTDLKDVEGLNWEKETTAVRTNYASWLNQTTSYRIREDLCEENSVEIKCRKVPE